MAQRLPHLVLGERTGFLRDEEPGGHQREKTIPAFVGLVRSQLLVRAMIATIRHDDAHATARHNAMEKTACQRPLYTFVSIRD